jgi:four helix bundle protein
MFKFEKLNVWEKSFYLGEKINNLAMQFPDKERFNLSNQLTRAIDSVGLNIAEGSAGQTNYEQIRFIIYANRSLLEVVACLLKAKERGYIYEQLFNELYQECEILSKMLSAFKNALQKNKS